MDQHRVARLRAPLPNDAPIAESRAVVGLQDTGEARLDLLALMTGRIDVQRAACFRRLRLGARLHLDSLLGLAGRAVRIGELELAFVLGARLKIQDAAGEPVGHGVVEILATAKDVLAADTHEWQRGPPCRFADGAKLHGDRRVAIRVTGDRPFEAEVQERGMFDDETSGLRAVLRESCRARGEKE